MRHGSFSTQDLRLRFLDVECRGIGFGVYGLQASGFGGSFPKETA